MDKFNNSKVATKCIFTHTADGHLQLRSKVKEDKFSITDIPNKGAQQTGN